MKQIAINSFALTKKIQLLYLAVAFLAAQVAGQARDAVDAVSSNYVRHTSRREFAKSPHSE